MKKKISDEQVLRMLARCLENASDVVKRSGSRTVDASIAVLCDLNGIAEWVQQKIPRGRKRGAR